MSEVTIPIPTTTFVETQDTVGDSLISTYRTRLKNCVVMEDSIGPYLTQRPPLQRIIDASDDVAKAKGRAVITAPDVGAGLFFINDDTVYNGGASDYATALSVTISSGDKQIWPCQVGTTLLLVDHENNEGWSLNNSNVVAAISDGQFPPNNGKTLAAGCAELDGYAFVLDTDGVIWNSSLNDLTAWAATDFIKASRVSDSGKFITTHHDHIVAFCGSSIEFFHNAGNASGSPLSRSETLFFNTGLSGQELVCKIGDRIYFVGAAAAGHQSLYMLEEFNLHEIDCAGLNYFLANARGSAYMAGIRNDGRDYVCLTFYDPGAIDTPQESLVWSNGSWHEWHTAIDDQTFFQLKASNASSPSPGGFQWLMMRNGDLVSWDQTIDGDPAAGGSADESRDIADAGSAGVAIDCSIEFAHTDFGTDNWKFIRSLRPVFVPAHSDACDISLNKDNAGYGTAKTISNIKTKKKLTALGRCNTLQVKLDFPESGGSPTGRFYLRGIRVDVDAGGI